MSKTMSARVVPVKAAPPRACSPPTTASKHGYDRNRDLPRLVNMWPSEVAALQESDRSLIVLRLMRALRAERRRGQHGAWTYDLSRHALLLAAYRSERRELLHRVLLDHLPAAAARAELPAGRISMVQPHDNRASKTDPEGLVCQASTVVPAS